MALLLEGKAARAKRRRDQVRSEILDVARDIVVRDGFERFSLANVAEQLELTKPALYYYFDSKPALLFELIVRELFEEARLVQAAVEDTESGADAVEQLMRTVFERYRERLDLFKLVYKFHRSSDQQALVGAEQLERIRPVNDIMYGGAEARLRADQRRGTFPKQRDPRLFVFNAHMAVIGILSMKSLVEEASDPLLHGDAALIDDICQTFRDAIGQGGGM